MDTKTWMMTMRTWWRHHGRIRVLIKSSIYGVILYLSSLFLERDVSYLWLVGATGFCLIALVWATAKTPSTGDSLTHPIFAIFIFMILANIYRYAFVAMDRPMDLFDGIAYNAFIGVCGGILGGMLEYLRTIGHMQSSRDPSVSWRYKTAFWAIIVLSLLLALWVYHDL